MRVPIRDIARFVNEGWPGPEWYMDDCGPAWDDGFGDDGNPRRPEEIVKLEKFECSLCWQGSGEDPTEGAGKSFVKEFKRWHKGLSMKTLVVEVAKHLEVTMRQAIANAGGKVMN